VRNKNRSFNGGGKKMFEQILSGIIGGIVYSFAGFVNKPVKESFDYKKVGKTLVISIVIGAIAGFMGMNYSMFVQSATFAGCTVVVEKLVTKLYSLVVKSA
jgi:hypothetical protein